MTEQLNPYESSQWSTSSEGQKDPNGTLPNKRFRTVGLVFVGCVLVPLALVGVAAIVLGIWLYYLAVYSGI
mgnify:CR=1 FL=1